MDKGWEGITGMKYSIFDFGIMAAIISFLGFIVENIWLAVTKGYVNNRNMNAPFLLGYGLLVISLFFVLGTPEEMAQWGMFKGIKDKMDTVHALFYMLFCGSFHWGNPAWNHR